MSETTAKITTTKQRQKKKKKKKNNKPTIVLEHLDIEHSKQYEEEPPFSTNKTIIFWNYSHQMTPQEGEGHLKEEENQKENLPRGWLGDRKEYK